MSEGINGIQYMHENLNHPTYGGNQIMPYLSIRDKDMSVFQ